METLSKIRRPNIISPIVTKMARLSPLKDGQYHPASGATSLAIRHGSVNLIPINKENTEFILIDAGMDKHARKIRRHLGKLGLDLSAVKRVYITHSHPDHIRGLQALKNVPVYMSEHESRVLRGELPYEGFFPKLFDKFTKHQRANTYASINPVIISHGYKETVGNVNMHAMDMPGHTSGSTGYLVGKNDGSKAFDLFPGDGMDIDRHGNARNAAPPFTADTKISDQSITDTAEHIARLQRANEVDIVHSVLPSHSGSGDYSSVYNYRRAA